MHGAGWVHRDVSPGNVLVGAEGKVRLADLEYAKKVNEGQEFRVVRPQLSLLACIFCAD